MSDVTLAEVVRQLEREPTPEPRLAMREEPQRTAPDHDLPPVVEAHSSLVDGLRSTERLLESMEEQCRHLQGYRRLLIDRLRCLERPNDRADEPAGCEIGLCVPGPESTQ